MATPSAGSQVLKGEVVPAAEFWSGLPASFSSTVDDARSAFEGLRPPAVEGEFTPEGVASGLGLSLPAAWKLLPPRRGDDDAAKLFASLSRARKVAHLSKRRTLPPFHLRPPHLRPGKLALVLECAVRTSAGHHSRLAPRRADAVAAVRKARVLLVAKHLEVDEDNAKAVLRAARAGDEGSRAQLQSETPRRPGPRPRPRSRRPRPGPRQAKPAAPAGRVRALRRPGRERARRGAPGVFGGEFVPRSVQVCSAMNIRVAAMAAAARANDGIYATDATDDVLDAPAAARRTTECARRLSAS